MTARVTGPLPHTLQPWQLVVIDKLGQAKGAAVPTRALLSKRVDIARLEGLLRWLGEQGIITVTPCPRCPCCMYDTQVAVVDEVRLRALVRWSDRRHVDTAIKTRRVADAS